MQLNITGHNVEITEALRDFVNAKFAKLEQYFERINQCLCCVESGESDAYLGCDPARQRRGTSCQCGRARHVRGYRRLD